jgi:DNA-binding phage protein
MRPARRIAAEWMDTWIAAVRRTVEQLDLNAADVAADAGVSPSTVRRVLRGETSARVDTVIAVSVALARRLTAGDAVPDDDPPFTLVTHPDVDLVEDENMWGFVSPDDDPYA